MTPSRPTVGWLAPSFEADGYIEADGGRIH
jgi:hypothetical protein